MEVVEVLVRRHESGPLQGSIGLNLDEVTFRDMEGRKRHRVLIDHSPDALVSIQTPAILCGFNDATWDADGNVTVDDIVKLTATHTDGPILLKFSPISKKWPTNHEVKFKAINTVLVSQYKAYTAQLEALHALNHQCGMPLTLDPLESTGLGGEKAEGDGDAEPLDGMPTPDEEELFGLISERGHIDLRPNAATIAKIMKRGNEKLQAVILTILSRTKEKKILKHFLEEGGAVAIKNMIKTFGEETSPLKNFAFDVLATMPMTVKALKESRIGKTMSNIAKNEKDDKKSCAEDMIDNWKDVQRQEKEDAIRVREEEERKEKARLEEEERKAKQRELKEKEDRLHQAAMEATRAFEAQEEEKQRLAEKERKLKRKAGEMVDGKMHHDDGDTKVLLSALKGSRQTRDRSLKPRIRFDLKRNETFEFVIGDVVNAAAAEALPSKKSRKTPSDDAMVEDSGTVGVDAKVDGVRLIRKSQEKRAAEGRAQQEEEERQATAAEADRVKALKQAENEEQQRIADEEELETRLASVIFRTPELYPIGPAEKKLKSYREKQLKKNPGHQSFSQTEIARCKDLDEDFYPEPVSEEEKREWMENMEKTVMRTDDEEFVGGKVTETYMFEDTKTSKLSEAPAVPQKVSTVVEGIPELPGVRPQLVEMLKLQEGQFLKHELLPKLFLPKEDQTDQTTFQTRLSLFQMIPQVEHALTLAPINALQSTRSFVASNQFPLASVPVPFLSMVPTGLKNNVVATPSPEEVAAAISAALTAAGAGAYASQPPPPPDYSIPNSVDAAGIISRVLETSGFCIVNNDIFLPKDVIIRGGNAWPPKIGQGVRMVVFPNQVGKNNWKASWAIYDQSMVRDAGGKDVQGIITYVSDTWCIMNDDIFIPKSTVESCGLPWPPPLHQHAKATIVAHVSGRNKWKAVRFFV